MKIGVIQASSQKSKNQMLYEAVCNAAKGSEVINFGCFADEAESYSYTEIALQIGLLLESGAVDFIVTGCSSGRGMMLACNALPGVICGYCPTPQDAFLFGRINGGNAVSLPLGLGFGWCGEINLRHTLQALFDGEFGCGYPPEDAERKKREHDAVEKLKAASKRPMKEILETLDSEVYRRLVERKAVADFILEYEYGKMN